MGNPKAQFHHLTEMFGIRRAAEWPKMEESESKG